MGRGAEPPRTTPPASGNQVGNPLVPEGWRMAGTRIPPMYIGKPNTIPSQEWLWSCENYFQSF